MLSKTYSYAISGIDSYLVVLEIEIRQWQVI